MTPKRRRVYSSGGGKNGLCNVRPIGDFLNIIVKCGASSLLTYKLSSMARKVDLRMGERWLRESVSVTLSEHAA